MADNPARTSYLERRLTELEAQLSRAEHERARWRAIFMELPACVAITRGPEHVFEFANRAYERIANTQKLVGRQLAEIHPELERQGLLALTDQIYQSGIPRPNQESPAEIDLPDGTTITRYFNGTVVPLKDERGQVEGLINFQYDVTDLVESRKQKERAQERLALAAEAGRLGLWEWDPEIGIMWKSEDFCQVFGYAAPVEWNYEIFVRHVHPQDRERLLAFHAQQAESPNAHDFEFEYRVIWPDGSIHWLKDKGRSIRDSKGRLTRVIGATIDISFQKESEASLERSKEAAESANIAKTHFLANMSHELRTPLAAIIGFSGLLSNPALEDERRKSYAETIERNGLALASIIDDILDFAKIESGHISISVEPFDFAALLKEVQDIVQLEARRKNLVILFSFAPDASDIIEADRGRLRQILLNVIGNAIKFTQSGSVSVETRITPNQIAEISVRDTGVGIASEDQQKLFQPFSQADSSSSRRFGGTGLGLAISRRYARAMGGDVALVRSEPNGGSVFRVTIGTGELKERSLQ
jgi:PAS domain S-box-containing protein